MPLAQPKREAALRCLRFHEKPKHLARGVRAFGLLEHRREAIPDTRFGERNIYRKSPLFNRVLRFDVRIERESEALN
jgi:hypothetical protein